MYAARYEPPLAGLTGRLTIMLQSQSIPQGRLEQYKGWFWAWLHGAVPALPVIGPMRIALSASLVGRPAGEEVVIEMSGFSKSAGRELTGNAGPDPECRIEQAQQQGG